MSTPYETFRATLPAATPDGQRATVIVTRQGWGSDGRVRVDSWRQEVIARRRAQEALSHRNPDT